MKRLTLLRHAKSSWDEPDADDFDRPLNDRGRKAARRMGKALKHRKIHFDVAIASTAARVRETLDGLEETYGDFLFPVHFDQRVYLASSDELLRIVRALPADAERALIVGHNPGLERLAITLTADDDDLRHKVEEGLPTAALVEIELPVDQWIEVGPGDGTVEELILPRELD